MKVAKDSPGSGLKLFLNCYPTRSTAKEGILKFNQYEPGDKVFTDQFVVHTPGRCLDGYGREGPDCSLYSSTLYTDAASGLIYVECQTSMGAGKMVMGKTCFEHYYKFYTKLPNLRRTSV